MLFIFLCTMANVGGAAAFETLVPPSDAGLLNLTRVNKAKGAEQPAPFERLIREQIFQQIDLVKNLNEQNKNLQAQLDALIKENKDLKRPLHHALSSTTTNASKNIPSPLMMVNIMAQANNDQLRPLQWKFEDLPTTCSAQSVCLQAPLINGRTVLFDGKLRKTWIFGLTGARKTGTMTWTNVLTRHSPPRRQEYTMDSIGSGEKVILFGGGHLDDYTKKYNDTWMFDPSTNDWTQLNITSSSPSARQAHTMSSSGYSHKIILFGGNDVNQKVLNDTWMFDQITNIWSKVKVKSTSPPARFWHAMTSLENSEKILLFGGFNYAQSLKDTWIFDPFTSKWTENTKSTTSPSPRYLHAMAPLGIEGNVILFGGYVGTIFNRETWIYDNKTREWKKINTKHTSSSLSGRSSPAISSTSIGVDSKVILFGGYDGTDNLVGTWIFDQNKSDWTKTNATANILSPSGHTKHAVSSLGGSKVLLFGGIFDLDFCQSAWIFDKKTSQWMKVDTSSSPSLRKNFAMSLLVESHNVILFGGKIGYKDNLNDTWIFNQSINSWIEIFPIFSPSARYGYAMASIGNSSKSIIFGGSNDINSFKDTWIFDESKKDWKEINTPSSPSSRYFHAMASIGDMKKVILFGGWTGDTAGDTWIFDFGTSNWTEIGTWIKNDPSANNLLVPSPRSQHAMASMGKTAIMYGGYDGNNAWFDDTWLFHGESSNTWKWTQLSTQMSERSYHAMATITTGVVLFGGNAKYQMGKSLVQSTADDTWFIPKGCPIGHAGNRCVPCPQGTWKNNSGASSCVSCPKGTTNNAQGNVQKLSCVLCINGGHGTVSNEICTCDIFHMFSFDCVFPTSAILIGLFIGAIPIIIFYIWSSWKKYFNATVQDMNYDYQMIDNQLTINQTEIQSREQDRIKLCKAWIVPITEIKFKEIVGMGAFGEVRRGEWRGLDVAFKKMFPDNMEHFGHDLSLMNSIDTVSTEGYSNKSTGTASATSPNTIGVDKLTQAMLNNDEIGVMMRLRHPRIVTFLGAGEIIDPPMEGDDVPRVGIFVMLEYAAGGDLIHRLKIASGSITLFPWVERIQCALDIAEGMVYIHSEGFIHRDLKSLNILCDKNKRCMIADLGLTCSNVRPPTIELDLDEDYEDDGERKGYSSIQFNKHMPVASDTNYNTAWKGTAGKIFFVFGWMDEYF